MRRLVKAGLIMAALAMTISAQDWYQQRAERYRGNAGGPTFSLK